MTEAFIKKYARKPMPKAAAAKSTAKKRAAAKS
jgi:hypothetical protein